jgi:uroporphyrinogen decarboxylase
VPLGELAADFEITERALGRPTYYRSKWREYRAVWEGKRDDVVHSYIRDIVDLTRFFKWDFVGVPLMPPRQDYYELPQFLGQHTWREPSGRIKKYSPESGGHAMTIEEIDMALEDIVMPDEPVDIDWSELEAIMGVAKELGDTHFVIARIDGGSFPWDVTVGMEEFLVRMITQPEFVRRAIKASTRKAVALAYASIEVGCDAVSTSEDYADNRGPLMGPKRFREFCLPSLERVVKATHEAGGYFIKHSDGNHWAILDDFVTVGVDGWHGIQPSAGMGFRRLKREYGQDLCLFGGIECDTLVAGTPDDVREEVLHTLQSAALGGGLVFSSGNTLMVGTKYENYIAVLDALRQFGLYPLNLQAMQSARH